MFSAFVIFLLCLFEGAIPLLKDAVNLELTALSSGRTTQGGIRLTWGGDKGVSEEDLTLQPSGSRQPSGYGNMLRS